MVLFLLSAVGCCAEWLHIEGDISMKRDIWIALFFLGLLLFGWPFLSIFHHLLPYYLFIIWFIFIGLIYLASRASDRQNGGG
jgi:uncharacterized membrane protein HdeD (DUF308 family)